MCLNLLTEIISVHVCDEPTCDVYSGPGDAFNPVAAM